MILYDEIRELSDKYEIELKKQIDSRIIEMYDDDLSHHMLYQVLGISSQFGKDIDTYQNIGRFLYKYAGSFLEEAAFYCIKYKFPNAKKIKIPNTIGQKPKTFEIDALVDKYAIEIKWRDATTDGDHVTKEHTRLEVIHAAGYKPIRLMFYYPNRSQAQKIQKTLQTLYHGKNGEYYYADSAWDFILKFTGVDLLKILKQIAHEKQGNSI